MPILHATAREIKANVESIQAVPQELLNGPARDALLLWAGDGNDVYCYRAGPKPHRWNVWVESERIEVSRFVALYNAWRAR